MIQSCHMCSPDMGLAWIGTFVPMTGTGVSLIPCASRTSKEAGWSRPAADCGLLGENSALLVPVCVVANGAPGLSPAAICCSVSNGLPLLTRGSWVTATTALGGLAVLSGIALFGRVRTVPHLSKKTDIN